MSKIDELLNIAQREVGTSDGGKYNLAYYGKPSSEPWCGVFVWWCLKQLGLDTKPLGKNPAYVPTIMQAFKDEGLWHMRTSGIRRGDIVLFDWNANLVPDHIGFCTGDTGGSITTIEGNTSAQNASNGNHVENKTRNKKFVLGYGRLPDLEQGSAVGVSEQTSAVTDKTSNAHLQSPPQSVIMTRTLRRGMVGEDVKALQEALIARGFSCGSYGADGKMGAATEAALKSYQKSQKLPWVDGVLSIKGPTAKSLGFS